ncbi:MAG: PHP domain-containing protein [Spirochaetota bacterium]
MSSYNGISFWEIVERLNASAASARLEALRSVAGRPPSAAHTEEVNNHVHTTFSFSPYSPTAAVWAAREAGLSTVGIVDHDTAAGASEFRQAGELLGFPTTTGFEIRVSMSDTALGTRRYNSPDSEGVAYILCHGLPHSSLGQAEALLEPVRQSRERRNLRMVARLNDLLSSSGISQVSYEKDVRPLSEAEQGGTVTERHIMYALAKVVSSEVGRGPALVRFLESNMNIEVSSEQHERLADPENPHLLYDLLGVLKSKFVPRIFETPDDEECMPVSRAVAAIRAMGAVPCYSYLGDIGKSVTGDKKAQAFEDAFLEELFGELVRLGFQAVSYMPPRNTPEQLARVQKLAREHGLMEISGVDINTSRQIFSCPETAQPEFRRLGDAAWALIEHERSIEEGREGLFSGDETAGAAGTEVLAARARERFSQRGGHE